MLEEAKSIIEESKKLIIALQISLRNDITISRSLKNFVSILAYLTAMICSR